MKTKILVTLLAIVALAGCTIPGVPGIMPGPTTIGGGRGLEIISFTAEPTTVYSGNTVRTLMDVQNLGGSFVDSRETVSHAFAYLTGSNIDLNSTNAIYWRGKDTADQVACKAFAKNMSAPDVVKGTEGSLTTFKWNLLAPQVDAGQTRTDSLIGRVYTNYETGINGNIWVYTETEADAAKASNRALNKATFTTTSGPVAAEVSVNPDPLIIYGSDKTTTLTIKISNVASGTIYNASAVSCSDLSILTDELNKVVVDVTAPDFSGITGCEGVQELVAGKPTTVMCDLTVTGSVPTFRSFPLSVTVNYGYYTERAVSVTVQGK